MQIDYLVSIFTILKSLFTNINCHIYDCIRDLINTFGLSITHFLKQSYPKTAGKPYIVQKNKIDGKFDYKNAFSQRKMKILIKDLAGTANKASFDNICDRYGVDICDLQYEIKDRLEKTENINTYFECNGDYYDLLNYNVSYVLVLK